MDLKGLLSNSIQKDLLDLYSLHRYIPLRELQVQSDYEVNQILHCSGKSYLKELNTSYDVEEGIYGGTEKRVRKEYRFEESLNENREEGEGTMKEEMRQKVRPAKVNK